jgi:putative FmdB family regulatory protein
MPIYEYDCESCQTNFERTLRMSECDTPQNCPGCGKAARKMISSTSFVLKGDSWPGKAIRVKGQMASKNRRLDTKMKERPSPVTLAPNVNGEQVDSWADAQKLAADKGKDTSTYEPLVTKEQKGS